MLLQKRIYVVRFCNIERCPLFVIFEVNHSIAAQQNPDNCLVATQSCTVKRGDPIHSTIDIASCIDQEFDCLMVSSVSCSVEQFSLVLNLGYNAVIDQHFQDVDLAFFDKIRQPLAQLFLVLKLGCSSMVHQQSEKLYLAFCNKITELRVRSLYLYYLSPSTNIYIKGLA